MGMVEFDSVALHGSAMPSTRLDFPFWRVGVCVAAPLKPVGPQSPDSVGSGSRDRRGYGWVKRVCRMGRLAGICLCQRGGGETQLPAFLSNLTLKLADIALLAT